MAIHAYEYLFYKLYQWSVKANGKNYYHKSSASIMIAVTLMLNTVTLVVVISAVTGIEVSWSTTSKYMGGLVVLGYALFTYAYFSFKDRYLTIISQYENEDAAKEKYGNRIVGTYVIGSFILMFISGLLFI